MREMYKGLFGNAVSSDLRFELWSSELARVWGKCHNDVRILTPQLVMKKENKKINKLNAEHSNHIVQILTQKTLKNKEI